MNNKPHVDLLDRDGLEGELVGRAAKGAVSAIRSLRAGELKVVRMQDRS